MKTNETTQRQQVYKKAHKRLMIWLCDYYSAYGIFTKINGNNLEGILLGNDGFNADEVYRKISKMVEFTIANAINNNNSQFNCTWSAITQDNKNMIKIHLIIV